MTKFKISTKVESETEIDVSFPLFLTGGDSSDVSADSWDYFVRIDEDGSIWHLTIRNTRKDMEYEFQSTKIELKHALGLYWPRPGSTYHLSNEATFSKAVKEAQKVLNAFPL